MLIIKNKDNLTSSTRNKKIKINNDCDYFSSDTENITDDSIG